MLARRRVAFSLLAASLVALLIQFGYMFAVTDIIAVKGVWTTYFPIFLAAVAAAAAWLARLAERRGWIG